MSLIQEALCRLLMDNSGVSGLVGLRVYPINLPQNPTYPAITYRTIYSGHESAQGGGSGLCSSRVSFSAWAGTYSAAKQLAEQIRLAVQGYVGTVLGVQIQGVLSRGDRDGYEPDAEVYEIACDYLIWHDEALTP